jgi:hypothetical protein
VYTSLIYVISGRNVNFLAKKNKKSENFFKRLFWGGLRVADGRGDFAQNFAQAPAIWALFFVNLTAFEIIET